MMSLDKKTDEKSEPSTLEKVVKAVFPYLFFSPCPGPQDAKNMGSVNELVLLTSLPKDLITLICNYASAFEELFSGAEAHLEKANNALWTKSCAESYFDFSPTYRYQFCGHFEYGHEILHTLMRYGFQPACKRHQSEEFINQQARAQFIKSGQLIEGLGHTLFGLPAPNANTSS